MPASQMCTSKRPGAGSPSRKWRIAAPDLPPEMGSVQKLRDLQKQGILTPKSMLNEQFPLRGELVPLTHLNGSYDCNTLLECHHRRAPPLPRGFDLIHCQKPRVSGVQWVCWSAPDDRIEGRKTYFL